MYNIGNYIQYPVITYHEKESVKQYNGVTLLNT